MKNGIAIIIGIGALTIVGAAALLYMQGTTAPSSVSDSSTKADRPTVTDAPLPPSSAPSTNPTSTPDVARETETEAPPDGSGVIVEVVDAETGAAVPNPIVWRVDVGTHGAQSWSDDELERVRTAGRRFDGDASGRVAMPVIARGTVLGAVDREDSPKWSAVRVIQSTERIEVPVRLRLSRDRSLPVHVHRASGAPAVGLSVNLGQPHRAALAATTDRDGVARIPHAQLTPSHSRRNVYVAIPLADDVSHSLSDEEFNACVAHVDLPPCATLDVDFNAADGGRTDRPVVAWITTFPDEDPSKSTAAGDGARSTLFAVPYSRCEQVEVVNGRFELPIFLCGRSVRIDAMPADGSAPLVSANGKSAANEGGVSTIEVNLAPSTTGATTNGDAVLRARILRGGEPLGAGEPVQAMIGEWGLRSIADGRTDGRGRVMLRTREFDGPGVNVTLFLRIATPSGYDQAAVDATNMLVPGVHDLGDVALDPSVVWASGRVIDEDGQPVAHCRVGASDPTIIRLDSLGRVIETLGTWTDAGGGFTVRAPTGSTPPKSIHLTFDATGLRSDRVNVDLGRTGFAITLHPDCPLRIFLTTPSAAPADGFIVRFAARGRTFDATRELGGGWLFDSLLPGVGGITVTLRSSGETIAEQDGVEIAPGTKPITIDLRDKLHPIKLHVLDDLGAPCVGANVWLSKNGDAIPVDATGIVPICLSASSLEVRAARLNQDGKPNLFGAVTVTPTDADAYLRLSR